jgi:hypothetical protein
VRKSVLAATRSCPGDDTRLCTKPVENHRDSAPDRFSLGGLMRRMGQKVGDQAASIQNSS